jgi:hypothetical protein
MRQSVRADQADAVSAGETHDQGWTVEAFLLVCEPCAEEHMVNEVDLGLAVRTALAVQFLDELLDVLHLVSLATCTTPAPNSAVGDSRPTYPMHDCKLTAQ